MCISRHNSGFDQNEQKCFLKLGFVTFLQAGNKQATQKKKAPPPPKEVEEESSEEESSGDEEEVWYIAVINLLLYLQTLDKLTHAFCCRLLHLKQ